MLGESVDGLRSASFSLDKFNVFGFENSLIRDFSFAGLASSRGGDFGGASWYICGGLRANADADAAELVPGLAGPVCFGG